MTTEGILVYLEKPRTLAALAATVREAAQTYEKRMGAPAGRVLLNMETVAALQSNPADIQDAAGLPLEISNQYLRIWYVFVAGRYL